MQSIGAVLVPLNTRFKGAEASDILRRSKARMLLTVGEFLNVRYLDLLDGEFLPDLERNVLLRGCDRREGVEDWEAFLSAGEAVDPVDLAARCGAVTPEDVLDIMFTSGTTGRPKAAISTHGKTTRTYWKFTEQCTLNCDDRYLIINPFFHTFGYKYGWMACVMRGACMIPMQSFDVESVMALIQAERVTMVPAPPTVYQMILAHPRRAEFDLSSLRMGQTGAATIPVELIRAMYRDLDLKFVLTGYGLTESCGIATLTDINDDPATVATTAGKACPGIEVRVVNSLGQESQPGEAGEILVRGDNVMEGYFDDPEATSAAIDKDGFLHTGDVGVMDEHGCLRITDRLKGIFIVGGFNCYPAEIENFLCALPGVIQAAVIGVPDQRLGEVGKAFMVIKPESTLSESRVIECCRQGIANFKVPRFVEFVESLPLNAAGKVLKTELRAREAERARLTR